MKGFKKGLIGGIALLICALITFAIANKFKSDAYFIMFVGGCFGEKISNAIEGD